MKPENAHLISLWWHLGLLVFSFGVQWSLFVQDCGGPGNKTQLWAVPVKVPDAVSRSEGKHAWPLCSARCGVLSSPYPVTPSKLRLTK